MFDLRIDVKCAFKLLSAVEEKNGISFLHDKNNDFSWYNAQSKNNLQNLNLFWRSQFSEP